MSYVEGIKTFTAGEDLAAHRRVKIDSGVATADPAEVVYADAGEDFIGVTEYAATDGDLVAVKLCTGPGSFEIEAIVDSAIALGTVLYGAADGKVSDASSGSAQGICSEPGTIVDNAVIEVIAWNVKSTTAATVSVADSGTIITGTTVEAALAEAFTHIQSIQHFIPIPLTSLREATNFDVGNIAANGGVLASDTTPILSAINDATDGCQRVTWAAGNNDQVIFQTPLPPNLDVTKDIVIHFRIASGGTTNAVGFTLASFFNESDTSIADTSTTNQTTSYAEKIATIAAADVPAGAQTLTVGLTPVAHTTDTLNLTAIWVEYAGTTLTS